MAEIIHTTLPATITGRLLSPHRKGHDLSRQHGHLLSKSLIEPLEDPTVFLDFHLDEVGPRFFNGSF